MSCSAYRGVVYLLAMLLNPPWASLSFAAENTLEIMPFEFRGHKLGEVVDERDLTSQGYACYDLHPYDRKCRKPINETGTIGGLWVAIEYYFVNRQFAAFHITFVQAAFEKIRDSFAAKFGPPHESAQEPVKNRMGGEFLNDVVRWKTTTGTLTISRYGASLRYGSVDIAEPSLMAIVQEREKTKAAEAAKDL